MPSSEPRVLIVGDSMAMPRDEIPYEKAWPYRLYSTIDCHLIDCTSVGITTNTFSEQGQAGKYLAHYRPDVVITQLGVVDCSPRYSNWFERRFVIGVLPHRVVTPYMNLMKRVRTRQPRRSYLTKDEFRSNLRSFYEDAAERSVRVISLKIAQPGVAAREKNPHLPAAVEDYNQVYKELSSVFDNVTVVAPVASGADIDSCVQSDGLHLNESAHANIAERLVSEINHPTTRSAEEVR